jgi:formylglycine-generating enzyme required for sulfatase activity
MGGYSATRVKDLNYPVEMIRWSDAARYCNARSVEDGLAPAYDPKSWECDFGDNDKMLQLYAWFKRNSGGRPHAVATKQTNPWGLHDMTGNLFQWCNDFYDAATYAQSPAANPTGPANGAFKVLRGE